MASLMEAASEAQAWRGKNLREMGKHWVGEDIWVAVGYIRETPPKKFRTIFVENSSNIFSFLNVRVVPEMLPREKKPQKYFNGFCSICGRIVEEETQRGEAHMKKRIKQLYPIPPTSSLCHGILSRRAPGLRVVARCGKWLKACGSRAHVAVREQCPVGVGDQGGEGCSWGEWDSAESKEKLGTHHRQEEVLSGLCQHIDTDLEGVRFAGNMAVGESRRPQHQLVWGTKVEREGVGGREGDSAESEERLWV
ncbi:hypothetical protein B0H14DRAFT_3179090 [Mycena olivaceomarginata]|nr:hypothetical protein B0H14DRAFT_3179090 [Mycena olivaceomarginata]